MKIARVFPRKTAATPDDELAFTTPPPKILPNVDEVHISITFTYDYCKAEQLAESWHKAGYKVKMGGVAMGDSGGDFVPGRYLRKGYVITSRGCSNHCVLCTVPAREGGLRELPITWGFIRKFGEKKSVKLELPSVRQQQFSPEQRITGASEHGAFDSF